MTTNQNIAQLEQLAAEYQHKQIKDYFDQDSARFDTLSASAAGIFVDYSKQNLDNKVLNTLFDWAKDVNLEARRDAMFSGVKINESEKREVLHTALRATEAQQKAVLGDELAKELKDTDAQIAAFIDKLYAKELTGFTGKAFTDVVAIGIGGSFYGSKVCQDALTAYQQPAVNVHYLANVDSFAVEKTINKLNAETTLVVVISKTFSTQETLMNATSIKEWLLAEGCSEADVSKHFVAVSTAIERVVNFGIEKSNIFPMWDWVGGRYSVWSAVGLPLAIAIGMENYLAFRDGARAMDEHFCDAPLNENLPVLLALTGLWNSSFLNHPHLAILPYSHALRALPGFLQQLDMESNGKSVMLNGQATELATGPLVFGQEGSNGQHAFMQLMHQSKMTIPTEFIVALSVDGKHQEHHKALIANCFAQSEALMAGKTLEQAKAELAKAGLSDAEINELAPHKVMPGNRPSSTIVYDKMTPEVLGALLALYEHKVFVQGAMWQINSFDQWGVELGKQLGGEILTEINRQGEVGESTLSGSASGLIGLYQNANK